jgi:hypothetical protein
MRNFYLSTLHWSPQICHFPMGSGKSDLGCSNVHCTISIDPMDLVHLPKSHL